MKSESEIVKYPIAKETTTVKSILTSLGILDSSGVKSAIAGGLLTIDGIKVDKSGQRIGAGQTLRYGDMDILVYLDEEAKRQRLTQSVMTGGTAYGNTLGKAGGLPGQSGTAGR